MSGDVNLRHTAVILFDAYDGIIRYETCLSGVQQSFFEKKKKIVNFIFTENIKILYIFLFILIHKYLKILFMFRLLINYPISI